MKLKAMVDKSWTKYNHYIDQLCFRGEKVIDSESFCDLRYLIKDGHVVLVSRKSGQFTMRIDVVPDLIKELEEVCKTWSNVNTKKCLL